MYPSSSDDSISKFFNASSVDIADGYFYIFWRAPPVYEYSISCSFNFAGDLDIQSSDIMLGAYRESAGFYAFPVSYDVDVISMPGVYQGLSSYTVIFLLIPRLLIIFMTIVVSVFILVLMLIFLRVFLLLLLPLPCL